MRVRIQKLLKLLIREERLALFHDAVLVTTRLELEGNRLQFLRLVLINVAVLRETHGFGVEMQGARDEFRANFNREQEAQVETLLCAHPTVLLWVKRVPNVLRREAVGVLVQRVDDGSDIKMRTFAACATVNECDHVVTKDFVIAR